MRKITNFILDKYVKEILNDYKKEIYLWQEA